MRWCESVSEEDLVGHVRVKSGFASAQYLVELVDSIPQVIREIFLSLTWLEECETQQESSKHIRKQSSGVVTWASWFFFSKGHGSSRSHCSVSALGRHQR